MRNTVGFKVWEEGKKVAIKMAKQEKPAEGFCPYCYHKLTLSPGNKIPEHGPYMESCPGVGAVVTPLKAAKR